LARSRSRNVFEKAYRALFFRRFYRCRRCGWRGTLKRSTRIDWGRAGLIIVYLAFLALVLRACLDATR
jgi:hypothetical protein